MSARVSFQRIKYGALALLVAAILLVCSPDQAKAATSSSWLAHEGQTITVTNLEGPDRYATNADIVRSNFTANTTEVAILASGENFPDALSASTLSGALDAPIVLVGKTTLPTQAANTLQALKPKRLIVIGSTAAVTQTVVDKAEKCIGVKGTTTRLGGKDRYATNAKIYNYLVKNCKIDVSREIILATGENFADALSISSYAAWSKTPIVLCGTSGIAPELKRTLASYDGQVTITGSPRAVSKDNESFFGKATIKRYGGAERYETSYKIARYVISKGMDSTQTIVATGSNFPDALSGSSFGGTIAAPIVLVDGLGEGLAQTEGIYAFCNDNQAKITNLYYLGSKYAINNSKRSAIKDLLKAWTITFKWDGKTTTTQGVRGVVPNAPSPKGYEDKSAQYTFTGWDKAIKAPTGNETYTALYSSVKKVYTVTWKGFDQIDPKTATISKGLKGVIKQTYYYGDKIKVPSFARELKGAGSGYGWKTYTTYNIPQRQDGSYCFAGWDKNVPATCAGDATFTATWKKVVTVKSPSGTSGGRPWPEPADVEKCLNQISLVQFNAANWKVNNNHTRDLENYGVYTAESLSMKLWLKNCRYKCWREIKPDKDAIGGYRITYYRITTSVQG